MTSFAPIALSGKITKVRQTVVLVISVFGLLMIAQ
jgi:hypothetical protein